MITVFQQRLLKHTLYETSTRERGGQNYFSTLSSPTTPSLWRENKVALYSMFKGNIKLLYLESGWWWRERYLLCREYNFDSSLIY